MPLGSLREFLHAESAGGVVLVVAAALAVVWANVAPAGYEAVWSTPLHVTVGGFSLPLELRGWINDAAMALFFFVVGLEIKRELVDGELAEPRRAALPIVAAVGGMVVPALIYLSFNHDGATARGWAIPMATDIAFAVGVLSLLGSRVPAGLKVFLLSVAIVDDIGAIAVIALFYSAGISPALLAAAGGALVAFGLSWRLPKGRGRSAVLLLLGVTTWLFVHGSGVHATIAGIALAFLVPANAEEDPSAAERVGHRLHPWSSFVVVPVFALANAGVVLSAGALADDANARIVLGVVFGLVVGKLIGITGSAYISTALGVAKLPESLKWRHIIGVAALGGIGFTVSLFVTELAFGHSEVAAAAKLGILAASMVAAGLGVIVLWASTQGREML